MAAIPAIGLPALSPPRPGASRAAAQVSPGDRVELGSVPAPPRAPAELKRHQAEKRRVDTRMRSRAESAPRVSELGRQLRKGELKDKAFQQAARTLHKVAHGSPDPLLARMARLPLYEFFEFQEPYLDYAYKMGPIEGPVYALEGRLRNITGHERERYYLTDESVTPFLASLYPETEKIPPTPAAVAVVARLAHGFYERAGDKLPDEIRKHETPEQDRLWADTCAELLEVWWGEGSLRIIEGGRDWEPGSLELKVVLQGQALALRGTTLDLTALPQPEAAEAREFAERIPTWKKDAAPGIRELDELTLNDRAKAERLVAQFVDLGLHPEADYDEIQRLTRILDEAAEPTVALFRPHLDRMTRMASEVNAYARLVPNNLFGEARARYYTSLAAHFPETVNERLLREEIEPLYYEEINTANTIAPLIWDIWDRHPELVTGSVERAMARPANFYPESEVTRLIGKAIEKDWTPSPLQKDWLLSWLYQPNDKEDRSLHHNQTFNWALKTVRELDKRSPGFLADARLPDTRGNLRPLGEALLERLLRDPEEDPVRTFFAGGDHSLTWSGVKDIYALAFPNDPMTLQLLEKAEAGYRRTGDCNKMDREEQTAMTILGSIELPQWADQRLKTLLEGERYRDQGWYVYNHIVDRYRQGYQAEALARVKAPENPLDARVAAAREYLMMGADRLNDWELDRYSQSVLEPFGQAVGDSPETFRALLAAGVEAARQADDLAQMGTPRLCDLMLAGELAKGRPGLQQEYRAGLRPFLSRQPVAYAPAIRQLFDKERNRVLEENLEALKAPLLAGPERIERVEENLVLAQQTYRTEELTASTLEAWKEKIAEPWAHHLASRYQDGQKSFEAVRAVVRGGPEAEVEKRAARFEDVLTRLNGENYHGDALKAFEAMSDALRKGDGYEQALQTGLRDYIAPDGAPEAGTISADETHVHVGSVSLPIRKG
ncbi:MAG: hypothetical protein HY319_16610 [Armatimonadetes bacterium]|nr:hypothetical protein [Armatimonadota bacterium]